MGLFDKISAVFGSKKETGPLEKPGRNELCWCGSGTKYKKCHLPEDNKKAASSCSLNCGPT